MLPPGWAHGRYISEVSHLIRTHIGGKDLGFVTAGDTGFHIDFDPDTVRAPDVAFVSAERLDEPDKIGYQTFAPDLAVEVVSPNDTFREVEEKARMWLDHGAQEVWVVEPSLSVVFVYRPDQPRQNLGPEDELRTEVVPGFAVPLSRLFG